MGSELARLRILLLFNVAAMLLFYIVPIIAVTKLFIFRRSVSIHHCMTLYYVSLAPHKFVRPPSSGSRVELREQTDRPTDRHGQSYMHSFGTHLVKNAQKRKSVTLHIFSIT
jgi:hypothetical protein